MKLSKQKIIIQDRYGGLSVYGTVRRTVRDIVDHGEYATGKCIVNGVVHKVQLNRVTKTWYGDL